MPERKDPLQIGWREVVALPDWGIRKIRAKIDTGARTSAIHCSTIEHLPDGKVRFEVVIRERPERRTRWVEAEPIRTSVVKPSTGERQERVVCRTRLVIGGVERDIEIGLVCREGMLCRMLLGRTAVSDGFLINAGRKYLLREKLRDAATRSAG